MRLGGGGKLTLTDISSDGLVKLNGTELNGETGYQTVDFKGGKIVFLTFMLKNEKVPDNTYFLYLMQVPDNIKPAHMISAVQVGTASGKPFPGTTR